MIGEQLAPQAVGEDRHLRDDAVDRRVAPPAPDLDLLAVDVEAEVRPRTLLGLAAHAVALGTLREREAPEHRQLRRMREVAFARAGEALVVVEPVELVVAQVGRNADPVDARELLHHLHRLRVDVDVERQSAGGRCRHRARRPAPPAPAAS